jgi:hypothetical protein
MIKRQEWGEELAAMEAECQGKELESESPPSRHHVEPSWKCLRCMRKTWKYQLEMATGRTQGPKATCNGLVLNGSGKRVPGKRVCVMKCDASSVYACASVTCVHVPRAIPTRSHVLPGSVTHYKYVSNKGDRANCP